MQQRGSVPQKEQVVMRMTIAKIIAPVMRLTGFRFSKDYRRGITLFHRLVYALVSTPLANLTADGVL